MKSLYRLASSKYNCIEVQMILKHMLLQKNKYFAK